MSNLITKKEVKKIFYEFVKESRIKPSKKKNFKDFIRFLEIDFYDWVRENLRSYFNKN